MIQIDVIKRLDNRLKEIFVFMNDNHNILNIEMYTNVYNEDVLKLEYNGDQLKICDFKQHEIQKSLMLLLNREVHNNERVI